MIGIANTWSETMPCGFHLRELAEHVKQGVREAGGTPMEFNTIAISDGISMGTQGMKASLISREVIADSIELAGRGYLFDGMVALVGCDKTIPGAAMALARLNIPSVMLYGGPIAPGSYRGRDLTIVDVFEAIGAHAAGTIDLHELAALEDRACPGPGACGGQFTANTMAAVIEHLGLAPMNSATAGATEYRRAEWGHEVGSIVLRLHRAQHPPKGSANTCGLRERNSCCSSGQGAQPTPCCICSLSRTKRTPELINLTGLDALCAAHADHRQP